MRAKVIFQWLAICSTFIVALVMEIAPWPVDLQSFRPAWLVIVLLYWVLAIPDKINIGSAFILGIIWDLVLGSILGVHSLVLAIFTYIITKYHLILRNLSLLQQSVFAIICVLFIRFSIFLVEFTLHSAVFNWYESFSALISGLLWPWLYLFLRKIQLKLELN